MAALHNHTAQPMVLESDRVTTPCCATGKNGKKGSSSEIRRADSARRQRDPPPTRTAAAHGNLRAMANRVELEQRYPESPERIREVLTDPKYLSDKLHAVGGPRAELVSRQQDECGVTVVLHHAVPGDALPSFLRSARPEGLTIRRTETWTNSSGSVHAEVDGVPGTITVMMHLEPDPIGCVLGAQLTAEVSLPLFAGKVEKMITDNVAKLMTAEYQFTLDWLRDSAIP